MSSEKIIRTSAGEKERNESYRGERADSTKPGKFLRGAAILAGAAVLSKLIGTMQKIPLQNMAGDQVFGLYNAVYPLYILILTLATAGIPLAVSKFVADAMAQGDTRGAARVVRLASILLMLTGAFACGTLFFSADLLAGAMGMKAASLAIRSASLALLVAPVMAAMRGYFQGLGDMAPTAVSQVIEQTARVAVMILVLLELMRRGADADKLAAGATFGSVAGGAAGLVILLLYWRRHAAAVRVRAGAASGNVRVEERGMDQTTGIVAGEAPDSLPGPLKVKGPAAEPVWAFYRRFTAYALPLCLGTIALPVLGIVDTFTVPRMLLHHGLSEEGAAHSFGLYNHGLPLVQLVTMVATSMSAALVPAVAQAAALNNGEVLRQRTEPILQFTWLLALAAAVGLAVTSYPVNGMLFRSGEGWLAMSIVSFTALFATLQVVSASVLQGMGAVLTPARSLFVAAALKALGNVLLVPAFGIAGAAAAAVAAYAAAAALNLRALRHAAPGIAAAPRRLWRLLAAAALMAAAALAVAWGLESALRHLTTDRLRWSAAALAAVAAGAAVYPAAILKLGVLTAAELESIPGFASRLKPVLIKLRLLRP